MNGAGNFEALYFDGVSARARPVVAQVAEGRLRIEGDGVVQEHELATIRVSERLARAPRLLTFADGGFLQVADHAALDVVLAATGFRDSWVVRWQNRWRYALAAVVATIAIVAAGYVYGLPWFARVTAPLVPSAVEARIGAEALAWIDAHLFGPSRLSRARQAQLTAAFARIVPDRARAYWIEFRASRIGPNAFALPNGAIVLTDELVQLADDDAAVLGVLAHELGHIEERHLLRRLISSGVTGAVVTLIAGDASGVLTALPATLADLSYSRDMEREADRHAIELLRMRGIALEPLAALFERMQAAHGQRDESLQCKQQADPAPDWARYPSTHPDTLERARAIRRAVTE